MRVKLLVEPLKKLTDGKKDLCAEGNNVNEVLDDLDKQYPGIKDRLFEKDGELRKFINIFVNDEETRTKDGMATKTKDGDEVILLAAVSGG